MLDPKTIQQICLQYDIKPDKKIGQHFLLDLQVVDQAVETAGLTPTSTVVEVGPGLGILTERLVELAGRVVAIELDSQLQKLLKAKFFKHKNFELIDGDVLKINLTNLNLGEYQVVANIPYGITARLIRLFLTAEAKPSNLILLVQKEVAERVCAKPGEMSLISLLVQLYGEPKIISIVTNEKFWPTPKVDSAILAITNVLSENSLAKRLSGLDSKAFWRLAKIGFSSRRKQLHNNLSSGLKVTSIQAQAWLEQAGLDPAVRAQNLSVDDWIKLAKIIENNSNK